MSLKQIPGTENLHIKDEFEKRYKQILGEKYSEFMQYSTSFIRRSIRVNTLKATVPQIKKRLENDWKLDTIPWCEEGFWIKGERLDIGNLPEHILGYIYVQEAASMIPPTALEPKQDDIVLDLCAAPGSKTTQIAAMMQNKGILIANDISGDRIKALGLNLNRTGVTNAIITHIEGRAFGRIKFDKILVDAPCSATGTIRRNFKVLHQYNYSMVKRLSSMQKGLLQKAFDLAKDKATIVYSTCSMEPEENEGVVDHILEKNPEAKIEKIEFNGKRAEAITSFDGKEYSNQVKNTLRIWPQDNNTEGFFVARIAKNI